MQQDFLSLPPYIWKEIFSLLKVLGAGLLLALFAAKYQKRKVIELQLKGNLLKLQLETYVKINELVSKIKTIIAPPLQTEEFYDKIICKEELGIKSIEYSSFFDSMEEFVKYYHDLINEIHKEHIYMQYSVEIKLNEYVSYLSEYKKLLDAFCDLEHSAALKLNKNIADKHIRMAYQLVGVCVQNDMARFYAEMDQMFAYEISHISLSYKSHYLKSIKDKFMKFTAESLEPYKDQNNFKGKLANLFFYKVLLRSYKNSILIVKIPMILQYLAYVHYSHKYTPEQWYECIHEDELKAFHVIFSKFWHHG